MFVATDASGCVTSDKRKTIRSHVMRGKNTRTKRSVPVTRGRGNVVRRQIRRVEQEPALDSVDTSQDVLLGSPETAVPDASRVHYELWNAKCSVPPPANDMNMLVFCEDISRGDRGKLAYCKTRRRFSRYLSP